MKRSKNFFYRINPNEVLGEAIFQEDKEQWFMQFFHDLRNDDPLSAKTDLAKEIIEEAHSFRAKRSRAGGAEHPEGGGEGVLPDCLRVRVRIHGGKDYP